MKLLNLFFIFLFLLSAVLQYNDPDPYVWIPMYLFGAFVCYQAFHKKLTPVFYFTGWLVYGLYALYLFFNDNGVLSWWNEHGAENIAQSMKATRPWIEETREFFGLLILIGALLANWIWLCREVSNQNKAVKAEH